MSDDKRSRRVEIRVELAAPADAVWRAVSEAEELVRWFPPEARVTPGLGGSVRIAWNGQWQTDSRIEIWEPPSRLRTVVEQQPFDAEGRPVAGTRPLPIAIDYEIEGDGPRARLRLVQSGFGHGAEWDDEIEGVRRGWGFELQGLKHYLERHRGRARHGAWVFRTTGVPEPEAWRRLRAGFLGGFDAGALRVGHHASLRTTDADDLAGRVLVAEPWGVQCAVEAWGDGLFRASVDRLCGRTLVHVGAQSWAGAPERITGFERRVEAALARLFPE